MLRLLISTIKRIISLHIVAEFGRKILKSWEGLPSENALAFSKEIRDIKENQK
jgi:hypothetical protein